MISRLKKIKQTVLLLSTPVISLNGPRKSSTAMLPSKQLTHWCRVAYICVCKLTVIGSVHGLSSGRLQAIIWANAWIFLIRTLGTNFGEISSEIQTFNNMHSKMSPAKWRQFCLGLNVLWDVVTRNSTMELKSNSCKTSQYFPVISCAKCHEKTYDEKFLVKLLFVFFTNFHIEFRLKSHRKFMMKLFAKQVYFISHYKRNPKDLTFPVQFLWNLISIHLIYNFIKTFIQNICWKQLTYDFILNNIWSDSG